LVSPLSGDRLSELGLGEVAQLGGHEVVDLRRRGLDKFDEFVGNVSRVELIRRDHRADRAQQVGRGGADGARAKPFPH